MKLWTKRCRNLLNLIGRIVNMPKALEQKLKKEYPNNSHAVYGTLNKIEVAKKMSQAKHYKHIANHEKKGFKG